MDLNGAQQEARPSLAPRRQSNSYQQDEENKGEEDYDEEYAVNPATTHNVYSNESSPFPGLSQTLRSVGEWLYAYMACLGCCPAPASLLPSQSSRADAAGRASHHTGPGFRSDAYDSFGRLPSGSYSVSGSRSGYPGATNITHQQQQPLLPLASTSTSTGRSLSSGSRVCYPASASISALSSTSSSSLGAPFGEMEMEKHCAGLCLYSCGEVLLILRNSVNNDLTWDFPGGQLDPADYKTSSSSTSSSSSSSSLAGVPMYWSDRQVKPGKVDHAIYGFGSATWRGALREATEELGALPGSMELVSVHTSSRGGGSKLYTLYLCKVAAAARVKYTPRLSEEHLAWGWFPAAALLDLASSGPVALRPGDVALSRQLQQQQSQQDQQQLALLCQICPSQFELHPWVETFMEQHPSTWREMTRPDRYLHAAHDAADAYRVYERAITSILGTTPTTITRKGKRK